MRVSVIIPTYNRIEELDNAIKSVLSQSVRDVEILVVDDCSSYNIDILKDKYKDIPCIKVFRTKENSGSPAEPRNIGLENSSGQYIAFLDDDDMFLPMKLEKQLNFCEKNGYKMSCTNAYFSRTEKVYNPKGKQQTYADYHGYNCTVLEKSNLSSLNTIITSTVLLHSSIAKSIKFVSPKQAFMAWEDWDYWRKCLDKTKCYILDEALSFYNFSPRYKWHEHREKIK